MGEPGFRDAFANQAFRDALANQSFRDAMKTDAMKNDAMRGVAQLSPPAQTDRSADPERAACRHAGRPVSRYRTLPASRWPGSCASPPVHAESLEMDLLETDDLQLLYFDPAQTYLTPYVAPHLRELAGVPAPRVRLEAVRPTHGAAEGLLRLRQRAARAPRPTTPSCSTSRRSSQTFETFCPASERCSPLMNHEPVHVATMDVWNERDARWRRLFHGKPHADRGSPGIDPLQLPGDAARERAALVPGRQRRLHGDLDGRRLRPRPGRL